MTSHRPESVAREVQKELAMILRTEIDDPLIGFVTITDVEMSLDLRHADVYFSAYGEPTAKEDALQGLKRSRKFIRRLLGERLDLRYVPELRFHIDHTPEKAQRVEELLRAAAAEREAREAQGDDAER